ncbi:MAG: aldehyde ferredoxin oxidoreductase family protein, partial [Anaerolineales bacterium]
PLSSENVLMFGLGPLNGTLAPTSARVTVGGRSPLTGILGSGTAGGFWGAQVKWAGFDGLIIIGRSQSPVTLLVQDDEISIQDATDLKGLTVSETTQALRRELSDPQLSVACIGPAGENLSKLSTIIFDVVRSAGRGGMGAVMGSKNIKAIAARGRKGVRIHDPRGFRKSCVDMINRCVETGLFKSRWEKGTYGAFTRWNEMGALLTRNGQSTQCDGVDAISGIRFNEEHRIGRKACFGCPIPCWPRYVLEDGEGRGLYAEEVTASTFKELGARCGILDLDTILTAHIRLNELGLDTISTPAVIAFAMECFEKGILTAKDTGGKHIHFGAGNIVLDLIEEIAAGVNFGGELGEGIRTCSAKWGDKSQPFALEVKGLETPATDPRGIFAWGLGYVTSTRGGCHMRAYSNFEYGGMTDEEMIRIAGTDTIKKPESTQGKGKAVAYLENLRATGDSLELCHLLTRGELGFPEAYVDMLNTATGLAFEPGQLLTIGERIINVEHLFNRRHGLSTEEDRLPERFINEPSPAGKSLGLTVPLDPMLEEYYLSRGWDRETGAIKPDKLTQLGLQ